MNSFGGVFWILLIFYRLDLNLCEDCTDRNIYGCVIGIINMTSGDGAKLIKIMDNHRIVYIQKLIVATNPSGVFLQRISQAIAYLTYSNYREPTFHVPEGNTISNLQIMQATHLRAFIAGQNSQLETLVIEQCMLDRLPQTLPKMTMMKKLSITMCMLSVLRLDMLVENQNLSTLDLSYNQIRQIFPVTGNSGKTLSIEKLELSGNLLDRVDMSMFASMPKLVTIQILDNRLTHIEVSIPVTFPLLGSLYFTNNFIELLDLRNLTLPNLTFLSLSSNAMKQMPSLPRMLPELDYLALNENNLTRLDLSFFRPFRNLKDIYIGSNQIRTVHASSPVNLPVNWLEMEYNQITSFNITGFSAPNITSLNLAGNRLTVVPPVFERFPNIRLKLNENPLTCDTLLPYKDKIQNGKLFKDQVSLSRSCDTTSSFLVGEKIKVCCNS